MWVQISPPAPRQWLIGYFDVLVSVVGFSWYFPWCLLHFSNGQCAEPLFCARCPPGYRLCGNVYSSLLIIFQNIGSLPHGLVVNEPN